MKNKEIKRKIKILETLLEIENNPGTDLFKIMRINNKILELKQKIKRY